MTIKQWLTPDFLALNVILISLVMNFTIWSIVSNFTVDFKLSERFQTSVYASACAMAAIYAVLVILGFMGIISRYPYLYDDKFNFLLLGTGDTWGGNGPVCASVVSGLLIGALVGKIAGKNAGARTALAVGAVLSEAAIAALTLLWLVKQT